MLKLALLIGLGLLLRLSCLLELLLLRACSLAFELFLPHVVQLPEGKHNDNGEDAQFDPDSHRYSEYR